MLEGLRVLGKAYMEHLEQRVGPQEALLRSLVQVDTLLSLPKDAQSSNEDKVYMAPLHLLKDSQGLWRLEVEAVEEVDLERLYQVLWIGHARAKELQDRATVEGVRGLGYMLSQLLPALAGWMGTGLDEKSPLRQDIREFCEAFCLPLPRARKQSNYRWIWNLPALNSTFRKIFLKTFKDIDQREAQSFVTSIAKQMDKHLRSQWKLSSKVTLLYTLRFNGKLLARHPAYQKYQYWNLVKRLFVNRRARKGTCHLCGRECMVTHDTARFSLKLYITDKPGFASGFLKKNFYRNYRLCSKCYQVLLAGQAFLRSRLRSRLGTLVYVVPVFHHPQVQPKGADLETWAEYITDRWQASLNLEGWQAFQRKLKGYRRYEEHKAAFLLDFLFVEDDGRSVKLQHDIRDVPPSRLDEIDRARQQVRKMAEKLLAPLNAWDLGLGVLFYLFPVGRRGQGRRAFFQFLGALLTQRPVLFHRLIPLFLETASVHRFQKYGAYVHTPPRPSQTYSKQEAALHEMRKFLVQTQLLRNLLSRLNLLIPSGGVLMTQARFLDEIRRLVPPETWEYMQALGLNLAQSALFLLGMLVGEVAIRQQQIGSTPILNKIHFQGMDANKVRRLSNEILEQMRIYKALNPYTKDLFAAMRSMMDQAGDLLSPAENTYWVLSGYAFRHLQRFGRGSSTADTAVSPTA